VASGPIAHPPSPTHLIAYYENYDCANRAILSIAIESEAASDCYAIDDTQASGKADRS